ncbi:hypothetical protein PYW07_007525 [Mythimna separata]|uniref:Uncharacterized protein n=1 Tax=Mythimna separata TaxID=271217 RepID=A0AAD7Z2F5_MYTSE|nr:hypothetical protein PYW07_007525 [Mythimna separata]
MVSCLARSDSRLDRNLHDLLLGATDVIGNLASNMYTNHMQWQGDMFGNGFCFSRSSCGGEGNGENRNVVLYVKNWLQTHEEAQVMLASIMVVVGLWWLVRAVLTLLINLICPLVVVILAVVCVPQLRAPLLGQNYPLLANLLRNILLKMAENIRGC